MNINDEIVIGMPLKNGSKTIRRAVESILSQKKVGREVVLLIANDGSTDSWRDEISQYLQDPRIIVIDVNFGKTYAVRNFILDYVRKNMPGVAYIGRLDADDFLADEYALYRVEQIMDKYDPDVIIAGNKQMLGEKIIRENLANKRFFEYDYLREMLMLMSNGVLEGELPSCNIFVKPSVDIKYRDIDSAEDHWYLVDILLNKERYKIYIAESLIYAVYSIDGKVTQNNKKREAYLRSRKLLYKYFLERAGGMRYE